jgi:hypothetical protein
MTDQTPRDPNELAPGTDAPGDTDNVTAGEGLGSLNNDADQDPLLRRINREAADRGRENDQPEK